jgi:hypothetical protein
MELRSRLARVNCHSAAAARRVADLLAVGWGRGMDRGRTDPRRAGVGGPGKRRTRSSPPGSRGPSGWGRPAVAATARSASMPRLTGLPRPIRRTPSEARPHPEEPDTRRRVSGECGFRRLWAEDPDTRGGPRAECQETRVGRPGAKGAGVKRSAPDRAGCPDRPPIPRTPSEARPITPSAQVHTWPTPHSPRRVRRASTWPHRTGPNSHSPPSGARVGFATRRRRRRMGSAGDAAGRT